MNASCQNNKEKNYEYEGFGTLHVHAITHYSTKISMVLCVFNSSCSVSNVALIIK